VSLSQRPDSEDELMDYSRSDLSAFEVPLADLPKHATLKAYRALLPDEIPRPGAQQLRRRFTAEPRSRSRPVA
jgi:hypothetical protein